MKLIVGLGNPGPQYAGNRHNVGFMAVEKLCDQYRFSTPRSQFYGLLAEGFIGITKCLALMPQTYMNRSGISVGELARFYKIAPADVFVLHDELDVLPGKIKVKCGGGPAGHNGLKDIDRVLGQDYWRIRLGIGHPGDRNRVSGYVLQDFSKAEWPEIEQMLQIAVDKLPVLVQEGGDAYRQAVGQAQSRS